jgi:ligand-binding sensor domain-containing protein
MVQDKEGYIWLGTANGLYRYDGTEYKAYKNDLNDSGSLPSNAVRLVLENSKGDLWVFGHKYVSLLNRSTDKFEHFWNEKEIGKYFPRIGVNDKKGNIWLLFNGKISKFNTISREWYVYSFDKSGAESQDKIYLFFIDNVDNIWLGQNGLLYTGKLNKNSDNISFRKIPVLSSVPLQKIHCIIQDESQNLWLGTDKGLFCKRKNEDSFSKEGINLNLKNIGSDVFGLSKDKDENLWINTIDTIYVFESKSGEAKTLKIENLDKRISPLSNGKVIFHDNTGIHWIDKGVSGIHKIRLTESNFTIIKNDPDNKNSLIEGPYFSIYKDSKEKYWFGSRNGLCSYDEKTRVYQRYTHDPKNPNSISANNIYGINEDKKGHLWIGTDYKGLNRLRSDNKSFEHFNFYPGSSEFKNSNFIIRNVFTDSQKRTWFSRLFGVSLLNENSQEFINFELVKVPDPYIDQFHIFDIVEDDEHNIWIGGGNRLFSISKNIDKIDTFIIKIITGSIFGMQFHKHSGYLYLASNKDGLIVFDIKKKAVIKSYSEKNGLASSNTCCILEDDHKNLWLSTDKGISEFNVKTETFKNFNSRHGVDLDICATGAKFKNSKGEMFFGGFKVVRFHPDSIKIETEVKHFPIRLTSLRSLGKNRYFDKALSDLSQLDLKTSNSYIEISFACLDYRFPDERKYKYKLEGFDKEWIAAGKRNIASYANLKVGSYVFRVQSTNADGIWNPKEFSVPLIIHAENITQEPWFFPAIFFLLISGFIGGLIYYISNRQKKRELYLQKERDSLINRVQVAGLEALRSQMNPHFLYNVLNSVNSFISKNDRNTANKFLVDFGKLMRHILDNSGKHIHSIEEELEFLNLYLSFEYLRFSDIFNYEIKVDPAFESNKILVPTMLIQPLLENSIRHGLRPRKGGGMLNLLIEIKHDVLQISIVDNGIGMKESAKKTIDSNHRSCGRNNIKERIEILKNIYDKEIDFETSDLTDTGKKVTGTVVKITIDHPTQWILSQ